MRMNVDRKIASRETTSVRKVNEKGSMFGKRGITLIKTNSKPDKMYPHECHAAAEVSNSFGDPVRRGAFFFGGCLEFSDNFNVSLSQLIDGIS